VVPLDPNHYLSSATIYIWKNRSSLTSITMKTQAHQDQMRKEREAASYSLFTSLVQEWKAWPLVRTNDGLELENKGRGIISSVLTSLNAVAAKDCKYDDLRLSAYLGRAYSKYHDVQKRMGPKVAMYAMDTTDRVVDLVRTIGYRGVIPRDWYLDTDRHYALLYLTRVWGANLKYQTLVTFAKYEGLELPPRSDKIVGPDGFFAGGAAGYTITRRCIGPSVKAKEIRFTILQGFKKCLLPLEEEDWLDTVLDTRASLTAEAPDMSDKVYGEIVRTADELRRAMRPLKVRKNYTLSKSACIESSCQNGGFAGEFLRRQDVFREGDRHNVCYRLGIPTLVGDARYKGSTRVQLLYSRCSYNYQDIYSEVASGVCHRLGDGPAIVHVRVIPEPFKFRVISIGEFDVYSMLKPYQHMMWKALQRFDVFALTGNGADNLVDHVQRIVTKYWDVGKKFLSGDYKGATNFLSSYASQIMAETWFQDYPEFKYILKQSLFSSVLDFSVSGKGVSSSLGEKVDNPDLPNEVMTNGQLMGHPCSFPILCAVNAAICRMVLEEAWGRKFSLMDLPLLINGDDCLLVGDDKMHSIWRKRTQEVGLYESVGKSYFTDRFAMINSRYLEVRTSAIPMEGEDLETIPARYRAYVARDLGYVNLGILVGRKKGSNVDCEVNVSDKVTDETAYKFWQSASDNFAQMNLRCTKVSVPVGRYVKSFERFFSKIPLPLGVPKENGGFGLGPEMEFLFPRKNPFSQRKNSAIMLGEAYWAGGVASAADDENFPDFLAVAREVGSRLRKVPMVPKGTISTCAPEPVPDQEWTITTMK